MYKILSQIFAPPETVEVDYDAPRAASKHPSRPARFSSFSEAEIFTNSCGRSLGVMINYSDEGACVRFNALSGVANGDVVYLSVPLRSLRAEARVMWKSGRDVGLMFVRDEDSTERTPIRRSDLQ